MKKGEKSLSLNTIIILVLGLLLLFILYNIFVKRIGGLLR